MKHEGQGDKTPADSTFQAKSQARKSEVFVAKSNFVYREGRPWRSDKVLIGPGKACLNTPTTSTMPASSQCLPAKP